MIATNTSNITIADSKPSSDVGSVRLVQQGHQRGKSFLVSDGKKEERKPTKLTYQKIKGRYPFAILGYFEDTKKFELVDQFSSLIELKKKYPTLKLS